jgi:hypothetical protein
MRMEENEFWPLIREQWGEKNLADAGQKVSAAKASGTAGVSAMGALGKVEQATKDAIAGD